MLRAVARHARLRQAEDAFNDWYNLTHLPEVLDCHAVSGDADYLLRIVAPDLPAFSELMMKRVLRLPGVAQVRTHIALQQVKQSHVLPLDHLTRPASERRRLRYAGAE